VDESLLTGDRPCAQGRLGRSTETADPAATTSLCLLRHARCPGQVFGPVTPPARAPEIGKIGKALPNLETGEYQPANGRRAGSCATLPLSGELCVLVVVVFGLTRGNWLEGSLAGITWRWPRAEEFPVVLTVSWRSGAWRIRSARCSPPRAGRGNARRRHRPLCGQDPARYPAIG